MAEKTSYKPIGGVLRAELFPIGQHTTTAELLERSPIEVELWDYASSYEEKFSVESGQVGVEHTLTLVASAEVADEWLEEEFCRVAAANGVVARLQLACGESFLVGQSTKFLLEQPLRLRAVTYSSARKPAETPLVKLTLVSFDTCSSRQNRKTNN